MVSILINGKKNPREFQNMAMALTFASNNGDCRNAEKLEIAYTAKAAAKAAAKTAGTAGTAATANTGSNPTPAAAGTADGKK
jgi:hypothetical protein